MPRRPVASKCLIVERLVCLFAMPFYELDDAVLAGDEREGRRHAEHFHDDPTGLEAFVNHYHLQDYVKGIRLDQKALRRLLISTGEALVMVWSERLVRLLGERRVLFYLGGKTDVVLRFHLERSGAPWVELKPALLKRERMRVYRAGGGDVERLV
jgi:hypothetical protein